MLLNVKSYEFVNFFGLLVIKLFKLIIVIIYKLKHE